VQHLFHTFETKIFKTFKVVFATNNFLNV